MATSGEHILCPRAQWQKEVQVVWRRGPLGGAPGGRFAASELLTHLVLIVGLAVVGGAHGQDDDHDQQSSAGGQDGDQGFVICWFLGVENTAHVTS